MAVGCSVEAPGDRLSSHECQDRVRDRLKDPDSAEFSDEQVHDYGSDVYRVEGVVRSRNGFGGMVVGRYSCAVSVTNELATVSEVRVE